MFKENDLFRLVVKYTEGPIHPYEPSLGNCLLFTGFKNKKGYGLFWFNGTMEGSHRVVLKFLGFDIPKDKLVRHSCFRPACGNSRHLSVGTPKQNSEDTMLRNRQSRQVGATHGMSKLTDKKVIKIRVMYATGRYSQIYLARKFNVSRTLISNIILFKTWKHI